MTQLSNDELRHLECRRMSESSWDDMVCRNARLAGFGLSYHTHDSRGSKAGFPDRVFVRPGRIIFVELKTESGYRAYLRQSTKTVRAQKYWIDTLNEFGFEAYVWCPSMYDEMRSTFGLGEELTI